MAERLSLELELLDKVGGPAKKAASALRSVEIQAKKASNALDFSKELDRTKAQLNKIKLDPKGFTDLVKAQKSLREEREKLKKAASGDGHHGFLASFKSALPFRSIGDYFKGAFWGHLAAHGVEKIAEGFVEGAHKAVEVVYDGIKEAFGAIAKEQERVAGYDLTLGKHGSEIAREDIERFSKKTAFSASQNMDQMLPLFRAGLKGQDARTTYAAALDLAAGRGKGSDSGAVNDAVELFAKIQQKGGVTTKQLAGIGLGETNIPAFYKDLGKYLHISAKEAEKKASEPGGIDPQILRNSIVMAIEKQQGGMAGTGAEKAGSSLFGMWNKLKELPEDFFEKLVNSPAIPKITKAMAGILEKLDPDGPVGKRIISGLERVFDKLASFIEDTITPENIDKAVAAFEQLPGILAKVWEWSKLIAEIFVGAKIAGVISSIASAASGLSTAVGGFSAAMALPAAALLLKGDDHSMSAPTTTREKEQHKGQHLVDYGDNFSVWEDNEPSEFNSMRGKGPMANKAVSVSVGGVSISVHPAKDDVNHTGQKAAQTIVDAVSDALERGYQEGGGG